MSGGWCGWVVMKTKNGVLLRSKSLSFEFSELDFAWLWTRTQTQDVAVLILLVAIICLVFVIIPVTFTASRCRRHRDYSSIWYHFSCGCAFTQNKGWFKLIVKPESEVPKSKVPKLRPKGLGLTLKSHGPSPHPTSWHCWTPGLV